MNRSDSASPLPRVQTVDRDVRRLRRWLEQHPRRPAREVPGRRRTTQADRALAVACIDRFGKLAHAKRNPHVGREDLIGEACVSALEAIHTRGFEPSPDRIVKHAARGMGAAIRRARRESPGRLACDCLGGPDGSTPLSRATEDDAVAYGRGPLDLRPMLDALMARLPRRERIILVLHAGLDGKPPLSFSLVGRAMGISESQCQRIEVAAIERLRVLAQGLDADSAAA